MKQDSQRDGQRSMECSSVPGNDMDALVHAFELANTARKPTVIIANM